MSLRISPNLELPDEAVTQTFGILAKRGAGKTYTAAVMVEEMLAAKLQVVVADPIGVWWGLRSSADGRREGLPIVVLGGDHGDVPLELTAGKVIADLVVDERLSVVMDLSGFRKGEQVRFMTDFAERLYHRNRQPLHLVLDEADAFAPQNPRGEQTPRLLGAIEDLVRRGRARGIGVTLISQRSAVLNKDVLTQVEVLVALRTIGPQDRKAIDAWVVVHGTPEQREEMMGSLASLPIGTAWFWSPGWLDLFLKIKVRKRKTFDSSATPEVGATPMEPRRLAQVDLDRLHQRMKDSIERAEADDPRILRARIRELEVALSAAKAATETVTETVVETVEVPVLTDDQVFRLEAAASALLKVSETVVDLVEGLRTSLVKMEQPHAIRPPVTFRKEPIQFKNPQQARRPDPVMAEFMGDVQLKLGARRIVEVVARHHPLTLTKTQVATLSNLKVTGGTFQTYWSQVKRAALVDEQNGEVTITDAGLAYTGVTIPNPMSTSEIIEMWRSKLKKGAREMLDSLVSQYPNWTNREQLAAEVGMEVTGGTFQTYLGTLRRNGLIETEGSGVRAAETLFLS